MIWGGGKHTSWRTSSRRKSPCTKVAPGTHSKSNRSQHTTVPTFFSARSLGGGR